MCAFRFLRKARQGAGLRGIGSHVGHSDICLGAPAIRCAVRTHQAGRPIAAGRAMTVLPSPFPKSPRYFPPLSQEARALEHPVRKLAAVLPEPERMRLYEALSRAHPDYMPSSYARTGDQVVLTQGNDRLTFPAPLPLVKYFLTATGYLRWLYHKYTLPGFVEVLPGDHVLDCGAYVGGFGIAALRAGAGALHCVEPAPDNATALTRNLERWPNATVHRAGLYKTTSRMELNLSTSSVEHSFLQPDAGGVSSTVTVPVYRLDDFAPALAGTLDFLKVEAEGVETEIIEGMGDLRPGRIAIDVSPERDGTSPSEAIQALLRPMGYEVHQRGQVLFARHGGRRPRRRPTPPKVIHAMWHSPSGQDRPDLVDLCLDCWAKLNPDYELRLVTK